MIPGAQGESPVPTADDVPSLATLFVGEGTERPIQLDNGELVDIGHVFPGIQAIQDPVTPLLGVGIHNDDGATWSGDVGQAMVAAEEDPSLSVDEAMQRCAPTEDLNGDLDGIALGSTWDPSKSLSEQLGEYYQDGGVDQRFTQFCATEGLEVGPDGALTEDARAIVADEVDDFAELFRFRDGLPEDGLWPNQFDPTSPESLAFTDRFVAYLEQGLARERATSAA